MLSKDQLDWLRRAASRPGPIAGADAIELLDMLATLTEHHRLVSREVRAYRALRGFVDVRPENFAARDEINAARAAVDAANALAKGEE